MSVPLPPRDVTPCPQKLESDVLAELTAKHCVDITAFVPDEFAADTEALAQRMPQVPPRPRVLRTSHALTSRHVCSCLWTATCCSSQATQPMATPMLSFFSRARGWTASAT